MLSAFLKWWLGELALLVPGASGARRAGRGERLLLEVGEDRIRVCHGAGARRRELGEVPAAAGPAPGVPDALRARLARLAPRRTTVEVHLAPGLALVKDVELPVAARENLREVLGFEMERLTPFRAEDVYFDHAVLGRGEDESTVRVRLVVAPRAVVDRALALVEDWAPEPAPGSVPVTAPGEAVVLGFRPAAYREPRGAWVRWLLVAANLGLAVAVVAVPMHAQRERLAVLEAELARVRAQALEASRLREAVERRRADLRFVAERKASRPAVVVLLEELSARLPDDTWLFRVEIDDHKLSLQGSSGSASALIALLEASDLIEDVRFASPVVREGAEGRERFHLSARIARPAADGEGRPPAPGGEEAA